VYTPQALNGVWASQRNLLWRTKMMKKMMMMTVALAFLFCVHPQQGHASTYLSSNVFAKVLTISKDAKKGKKQVKVLFLEKKGGGRGSGLFFFSIGSTRTVALPLNKAQSALVKVGSIVLIQRYRIYPTPRRGVRRRVVSGWRFLKVSKRPASSFKVLSKPSPTSKKTTPLK